MSKRSFEFDVLIIGSGCAGLSLALRLPTDLNIAIITKNTIDENSTRYAQGGVASVMDKDDSFESHIQDTLKAGCQLNNQKAVKFIVENGPECMNWLIELGAKFTPDPKSKSPQKLHLTREGGHSHRRILHAADTTGKEIEETLIKSVKNRKNIKVFDFHVAIDLVKENEKCIGAYIYNETKDCVEAFAAKVTILATGGASKVYLYSSNPTVSSGDGIAMGFRAGCKIKNMEFNQFHPTCLYHPNAGSFLITEAMRGEGAKLLLPDGTRFMPNFDERAELAPRDVVARAIDYEMKRLGLRHVLLDISFKPQSFIKEHFPTIYAKCLSFGIDITKEPIPVVPAAHYTCGGIKVNQNGQTNIENLYAIGEVSYTGLHGANRLASNSLLECLVYGKSSAQDIATKIKQIKNPTKIHSWDETWVTNSNEEVVLLHNWEEIRRFMWDYVGIVRSDKRLKRAEHRVKLLKKEIHDYYGNFRVNRNLIELRHLIVVAELIIKAAQKRKISVGLHYSIDCPDKNQ